MIRGIMFDLYDTLIYVNPDIYRRMRSKFARMIGFPVDTINTIWRNYTDQRFSGEITTLRDMILVLLKELSCDPSRYDLDKLEEMEMKTLSSSAHSYSGVEDMFCWLHDNGYKLALVSNASTATRHILGNFSWMKYFDHVILSGEVRMVKPHPEIYKAALELLGMSFHECFFVGDGGSLELDGARHLGIPTVKVVQDRQDPSYERSSESDFRIGSVTELPWLLQLVNNRAKSNDSGGWLF